MSLIVNGNNITGSLAEDFFIIESESGANVDDNSQRVEAVVARLLDPASAVLVPAADVRLPSVVAIEDGFEAEFEAAAELTVVEPTVAVAVDNEADDEFFVVSQEDCEVDNSTDENDGLTKYSAEKESSSVLSSVIGSVVYPVTCAFKATESCINNNTIMRGALTPWDRRRLQEGKISQLRQIGAEEVILETPSGDQIHSVYISVENFNNSMKRLGGERKQIAIKRPQGFLQNTHPIRITHDQNLSGFVAVRVDNPLSTNIAELVDFCTKNSCIAVWPDKKPVNPSDFSKGFLSSFLSVLSKSPHEGEPIYIIANQDQDEFMANATTNIVPEPQFTGKLSLFSSKDIQINGIFFQGTVEVANNLLTELKIQNTKWDLLQIGEYYFLAKANGTDLIYALQNKFAPSDYQLVVTDLPPVDAAQSGVVLATMNQTNSFVQYTHEMLMFLLEGTNVFFYDNAGKGLSQGRNTQLGLVEALETGYAYLNKVKHFPERKILVKGQCAGGVIASEAAKNHPGVHVWIDQSPNSLQGMVGSLFTEYLEQGLGVKGKTGLKCRSLQTLGTVVSYSGASWAISKMLPNIVVSENLRKNGGYQIFTIGVPDERGIGGDGLVPSQHAIEISQTVANRGGAYVPMAGATHVTDWWKDPSAYQRCLIILRECGIVSPAFQF